MPKQYINRTVNTDTESVEFSFPGSSVAPVVFVLDDVTPAIMLRLALHGASQKLGDAASGCAGDPVAAQAAIAAVAQQLRDGEWRGERTAGVGADAHWVAALGRALAEIADAAGKPAPAPTLAAELWTGFDAARRKGVRADPRVMRHHAAILREMADRAAAAGGTTPLDLDALLPV